MLTVLDSLEFNAINRGNQVAFEIDSLELTYFQLKSRVWAIAYSLRELGVKPGDRVTLILFNQFEYIESFYAVGLAGGVVNPINPHLTVREIADIVKSCNSKILIVGNGFDTDEFQVHCTTSPQIVTCGETPRSGTIPYATLLGGRETPMERPTPQDNMLLLYTSGTTGKPKGVIHNHVSHYTAAQSTIAAWMLTDEDTIIHALPLSHTFGMLAMSMTIIAGCKSIVENQFKPNRIIQKSISAKANVFAGVPTMFTYLYHAANSLTDTAVLPKFDVMVTAGSLIPQDILDGITRLYGPVVNMYGLTEFPSLTASTLSTETPVGSVGKVLPMVNIKILDIAGNPVPIGSVGEISVGGPHMMRGYWKGVEERPIQAEFFVTGDLGKLDENGYLFITGRAKDVIVTAGFNVYPTEVEAIIRQHPSVHDCAVFGIEDDLVGERVCAAVVSLSGFNPQQRELLLHCKNHLTGYKCPQQILFLDELPRNALGKVSKERLIEIILT